MHKLSYLYVVSLSSIIVHKGRTSYIYLFSFVFSFVPINIYAAGQTSSITLQIFLTLLFFLLLFDLSDNKNKKKILFFSIISGLLILTRGEFILIYIITLAYFFLKNKINLISLISIFLCTLITISPYLIRNYNTFHQVFIVKSIGFNLWNKWELFYL